MDNHSRLIFWPGFAALLSGVLGTEFSIAMAMILLVALSSHVSAVRTIGPGRPANIVAAKTFVAWIASFWVVAAAATAVRTPIADWLSSMTDADWQNAALGIIAAVVMFAGLLAGAVQHLVLTKCGVKSRLRTSLVGLGAGFAILGFGFIWNLATGSAMTVIVTCFLSGVPAYLMLTTGAEGAKCPGVAMVAGKDVQTGRATWSAMLAALLVILFTVLGAGVGVAELSPFGRHGTTPLSLAILGAITFFTAMGAHRLALGAQSCRVPGNAIFDADHTDRLSLIAMAIALGFPGLIAIGVGLAGLIAVGVDVEDATTRQATETALAATFMVARGRVGLILDFMTLGTVIWGLYALYAMLTLDPINGWLADIPRALFPER